MQDADYTAGQRLEGVATMCAGCRTISEPHPPKQAPAGWTCSDDDPRELWCPECSGAADA